MKNSIACKIKNLDHLEEEGRFNESLRVERKVLKEEFEEVSFREEMSLARKAKVKWLTE